MTRRESNGGEISNDDTEWVRRLLVINEGKNNKKER